MPLNPQTPAPDADDGRKVYDHLQARFASRATLSIDYRTYNLKQLGYLLKDNESAIQAAMYADLDEGPFQVNLCDVSCDQKQRQGKERSTRNLGLDQPRARGD